MVVGRWHGAAYGNRPLALTREYLTLVRKILDGETVSFDGDFYRCTKVRLGCDSPIAGLDWCAAPWRPISTQCSIMPSS